MKQNSMLQRICGYHCALSSDNLCSHRVSSRGSNIETNKTMSSMQRLKKYLKIVEYILVALLLGVTFFAVVEYAQGVQPIYVVSDNPSSMSPTINYGDAFLVYPVDFNSLQPNDIIVFNDPRGHAVTVVHRVVAVNFSGATHYVTTKGDNNLTNPSEDPWELTSQYYKSKVILIIPYAGYLSPALWGLSGPTFIILAITVILIISALSYLLKKSKKPTKEGSS